MHLPEPADRYQSLMTVSQNHSIEAHDSPATVTLTTDNVGSRYVTLVVRTAAELEAMSPAERRARFEQRSTSSTISIVSFRANVDRTASSDFQTFELLQIVEQFATGFDDLPALIQGRDDDRILISTGEVVRSDAVIGQASFPTGRIFAQASHPEEVAWPAWAGSPSTLL